MPPTLPSSTRPAQLDKVSEAANSGTIETKESLLSRRAA
jgi:hypothetical protein